MCPDINMMTIGFIGCGVVGGTTRKWILRNTKHRVLSFDPGKGMFDQLIGCDAIFISIPIDPDQDHLGDISELRKAVHKSRTDSPNAKIFIRSTVKPGTNDFLGTYSMPEFLTERRAQEDMDQLPIVTGSDWDDLDKIFPEKKIIRMSNCSAEIAKLAHNCFGAMKVTYWNLIYNLAQGFGANYSDILSGASITGFVEPQHTQVPGHDGKFGWGGKCFPVNIRMIENIFSEKGSPSEALLFSMINELNEKQRFKTNHRPNEVVI